jgi:class 3 adenylate cyclase
MNPVARPAGLSSQPEAACSLSGRAGTPKARRPRLSIVWLLPIALGLLTSLAVVPVVVAGFLGAQDVSTRLLRDRGELLAEAIATPVENLLLPVASSVDHAILTLEAGTISLRDDTRFDAFMRGVLDANDHLSGIGLVAPDGTLKRWSRSGVAELVEDDNKPFRLQLIEQARAGAEGSWSQPFASSVDGEIVLAYRAPIRLQGQVIGLIAAAVSVRSLSQRIAGDAEEFGATPFVLANRTNIVVHPALLGRRMTTDAPPSIDSIGDPIMAAIWRDPRPLNSSLPFHRVSGHWAIVDGAGYIYAYKAIPLAGLPMLSGYYVPSELSRRDRLMRYYVAGTGALVLLAAMTGAWWLGTRLAAPMVALGAASHDISYFRFESTRLACWERSRVREVAGTASAFARMASALHLFERYVPKQLVRELMTLGDASHQPATRELTVLFLDLENYTRFAMGRPAHEVANFLNRVFSLVGPIIEATGGTIDKYTGDGLKAFWGAPRPYHDHTLRAVTCAFGIASRFRSEADGDAAGSERICRMRIGLHTGAVVVGDLGYADRFDYTVVGDVVNRTKRIESSLRGIAKHEPVVIGASDAVVSACAEEFPICTAEPLSVGNAWRIKEAGQL